MELIRKRRGWEIPGIQYHPLTAHSSAGRRGWWKESSGLAVGHYIISSQVGGELSHSNFLLLLYCDSIAARSATICPHSRMFAANNSRKPEHHCRFGGLRGIYQRISMYKTAEYTGTVMAHNRTPSNYSVLFLAVVVGYQSKYSRSYRVLCRIRPLDADIFNGYIQP